MADAPNPLPTVESDAGRVRIAFTMLRADHEQLKREAEQEGTTITGLLRKAVATRRYLDQRIKAGARILTEQDGIQREVIFR